MKLLVLYDRESRNYDGVDYYNQLRESSGLAGHDVDSVLLSTDEFSCCTGCFGCWVKTPGYCVNTRDKANETIAKVIKSDIVIILSRVIYGSFSADIKVLIDRFTPLLLPFFENINGEMHHQKRYKKYPNWVALGYGNFTEDERNIFTELISRNAINYHTPKYITVTARNGNEFQNVLDKISNFAGGTSE